MNYNNRIFRGRINSETGEVDAQTRFHYRQEGNRIWANYSGGQVAHGHLQGKAHPDGSLEFVYHHENTQGQLMAGQCRSVPTIDANGTLVLKENWQWFTGEQNSGSSEIEEIPTP